MANGIVYSYASSVRSAIGDGSLISHLEHHSETIRFDHFDCADTFYPINDSL
jgi:hypothetical protein